MITLSETTEIVHCSSKRTARTHWGLIAFNQTKTRFFLMVNSAGRQSVSGCHPYICREAFPTQDERIQMLNTWRAGKTDSNAVQLLYPHLENRN